MINPYHGKAKNNKNPCAVIINVFLGFLRAGLCLCIVQIMVNVVKYKFNQLKWELSVEMFYRFYQAIFLFVLCNLSFYDLVCGMDVMVSKGSFHDRMKLSRLLHCMGYGGNYVDLFFFRIILWSLIIISCGLEGYENGGIYKKLNTLVDSNIFQDKMFTVLILVYIVFSIIYYLPSRFRILKHPWMVEYSFDPNTITTRSIFKMPDTAVIVANIALKIAAFIFVVRDFDQDRFYEEYWEIGSLETSILYWIFIIFCAMTLRSTYLLYRYNKRRGVESLFFFDVLFLLYLASLVFIVTENWSILHLVILAIIFFGNITTLFLLNCRGGANVIAYFFAKLVSRQTVMLILYYATYIFAFSGAYLFLISYDKQWVEFNSEWCSVIKELVDMAKILISVCKAVFAFLNGLIYFAFNSVLSIVICVLVIVLLVVAIALAALPFGIGSGGNIAYNISNMARKFRKFAKVIAKMRSSINSIYKFARKLADLISFSKVSVLGFLGPVFTLINRLPFLVMAICFAIGFWERSSKFNDIIFIALLLIMLTMGIAFLLFISAIAVVLFNHYDLGIIDIWFEPTDDFARTVISFVLSIGSIISLILIVVLSKRIGKKETDKWKKKVKLAEKEHEEMQAPLENERLPGERSPIIVEEADTKRVLYDTYLLKELWISLFKSEKRKSYESPSDILKVIFLKIFPFFGKSKDPRTVCKYSMDKACPCQHPYDEDREDFMRRNKPCNCCGYEIEFDANDGCCMIEFNKLGKIALLHVYLIVAGLAFYFAYFAISHQWYYLSSLMKPKLIAVIKDSGPDANGAKYQDQNSQKNSCCPTDVAALIKLFLGPIFDTLLESSPKFRKMKRLYDKTRNILDANNPMMMFNRAIQIIQMTPFAISIILLLVSSLVNVVCKVDLQCFALSCSSCFVILGCSLMSDVVDAINKIFALIPLLSVSLEITKYYFYGYVSYMFPYLLSTLIIVDWIAPPVATLRPIDFDEQIQEENELLEDPLTFNKLFDKSVKILSEY